MIDRAPMYPGEETVNGLRRIRTTSRKFDKVNEDNIFVRTDSKDRKTGRDLFSFMNIQIEFSSCKLESQYDEKQGPDYIKAYGFDYQ